MRTPTLRRGRHRLPAAVALALLAGCKPQAPAPLMPARAPMAAAMMRMAEPGDPVRMIAYTHNFVIELPSEAVQATQQKNLTDCLAAGCSVLNSRLDRLPNGSVEGSISVRIAPDKFQSFADSLTAPPARLISHAQSAEDKTTAVMDVEKRLAAQEALRDRLTQLLQQANGNVGDLVSVEKQLAEVQGTIESETAQRDYLRTITDTVKVDVSYNGLIQQAGPFDVSPIRAALDSFMQTMIASVGEVITWVAYALPWLPLAALAGWALRAVFRRRFP